MADVLNLLRVVSVVWLLY